MEKLRGLIALAGFLLLLGSAGAWEQGVIMFGQFAIQAGIGFLMVGQVAIGKR